MGAFTSPTDIKNRGLDHLGARRVTGAADGSRNSTIVDGVYDKLRQAELRRNLWRFATRKAALRPIDTTTMQLVPEVYDSGTQYYPADIVSYSGNNWLCLLHTPGGIAPVDSNGTVDPHWDNYFGPLTVDQWVDPSPGAPVPNTPPFPTAYHAGEIVYLAPGNGTFSTFISLVDGNADDPLKPPAWSATTVYMAGQLVLGSDNVIYQSVISLNSGNDPTITVPVAAWSSATTYAVGDYAFFTDQQIYKSLVASNLNNSPPSSPTDWLATGMWNAQWTATLTPQPRSTSNNWHFLSCTLQPIALVYPVGTGPLAQSQSANVFMLPYGYLHQAPTDSRKGRVAWVGGPSGVMPDDWLFQGNFIISNSSSPILIRFVSDFQNVTLMDPMFCEGLGARIGTETCQEITQALDKQQIAAAAYRGAMGEARTVNAIEVGPIDPPIDDYILVRQ